MHACRCGSRRRGALEKKGVLDRAPWAPSSLFGRAHHQRVIPFVCEDGDEHKESDPQEAL